MIALEKTHQNSSDYNQFLLRKRFEVNKKQIFSTETIRMIVYMIMLTRSMERVSYPMHYTGM